MVALFSGGQWDHGHRPDPVSIGGIGNTKDDFVTEDN